MGNGRHDFSYIPQTHLGDVDDKQGDRHQKIPVQRPIQTRIDSASFGEGNSFRGSMRRMSRASFNQAPVIVNSPGRCVVPELAQDSPSGKPETASDVPPSLGVQDSPTGNVRVQDGRGDSITNNQATAPANRFTFLRRPRPQYCLVVAQQQTPASVCTASVRMLSRMPNGLSGISTSAVAAATIPRRGQAQAAA